jgi:small subunit ribosomal protein S4e
MLDKMGGVHAPKPSSGPHKESESIPLIVLLRNKLKYALTRREALMICMQKLVEVDGRVRTDMNFPVGLMDVVKLDQSGDLFRILYDTKGRFVLHKIKASEGTYKLCKVTSKGTNKAGVPFIVTHDGRTFRMANPAIEAGDTIKLDLKTHAIVEHIKGDIGASVFVWAGKSTGRVGTLVHHERHPGSFDIVHVRDAEGNEFATRLDNVFAVGKSDKAADLLISLPRGRGIKRTIFEERSTRLGGQF